ncbi:chitobiase/beta-hexosaminidase C-terminal domain-containing protein [Candidatus Dojkabacteria bacterium]|uniref:Chitobiase/beta-hexosaminidase C-terminal domain-containing protein n=1 Tax=Candidatus Dojkabacteria bacterium TaxID=2099670 RepID=A0A955RIC3_9BACT|nr:chitobiase/beta-hexosaminidase C-terminal domain-containing protein [Candidatus Dojkabacteria bacterium]
MKTKLTRQIITIATSILVLIVISVVIIISSRKINNEPLKTDSDASETIERLPLLDYYLANSGYDQIDNYHFGSYVSYADGDKLYLAISSSWPASAPDGTMIATYDETTMTHIPVIDMENNQALSRMCEQGTLDILKTNDDSTIVVGGVDPGCPEDNYTWDWGESFVLDISNNPNQLMSFRQSSGLREVVHTWGITELNGNLYTSVSALHEVSYLTLPDKQTTGEIYKSTDHGRTWTRLTIDPADATSPEDFLSDYRVYDIKNFKGTLYATKADAAGNLSLIYSEDEGLTWDTVPGVEPLSRARMIIFNNQLHILATNARIQTVDEARNVHTYVYPVDLTSGYFRFNNFEVVGNYLYAVLPTGKVIRTQDVSSPGWEDFYTETGKDFVSIEYWQAKNKLVIGTRGVDAELIFLDIPVEVQEQVQPPTMSPNGGSFDNSVLVTLATETPGAEIRFTTDGTEPNETSTMYFQPVELTETTILKAKAYKTNFTPSLTTAATFTKNVPPDPQNQYNFEITTTFNYSTIPIRVEIINASSEIVVTRQLFTTNKKLNFTLNSNEIPAGTYTIKLTPKYYTKLSKQITLTEFGDVNVNFADKFFGGSYTQSANNTIIGIADLSLGIKYFRNKDKTKDLNGDNKFGIDDMSIIINSFRATR